MGFGDLLERNVFADVFSHQFRALFVCDVGYRYDGVAAAE